MPGAPTHDRLWLPLSAWQGLTAALPRRERWAWWRWALEQPGRRGLEATWQAALCRLVEDEATALQGLCTGEAGEMEGFDAALEPLRWCEGQAEVVRTCLATQLVQLVGRLHQWLVMEEAPGPERAAWFWCGWELLQWREGMVDAPLPEWWPPVHEQLVRLGALAWLEQARSAEASSPEGVEACTRALTLLQALAPLHAPLPGWIPQAQRDIQGLLVRSPSDSQPTAAAGAADPLEEHHTSRPEPLGIVEAMQASGIGPAVTLTAISRRLAMLPAVIASLRQQTYRPAHVHLHLSHEPHLLDQGIAADAPLLQEITADGWVQLHWVPNLGPYRKIVSFLQAGGYGQGDGAQPDDDLFITVDDDTLYPPRFIEYLVRNHERHGCIVAHRGRRIRLLEGEPSGAFRPYSDWHDGVREARLANLPTGQSGVLYRRSWFPQDLELEAALALAPTQDDLWLRWLTARQGVQAVILQPNAAAKTNELAFPAASPAPIAQEETLWQTYNSPAGGNDHAAMAVQAYWRARGFDLAALLAEEQERQADFY